MSMYANTQKALNDLAKFVIQQSRNNLTKNKKNVSRGLYESLDYDLKVMPNSFSLKFEMEDYAAFVDKGVRGKKSSYSESKNSPFSFKNKKPPMQPLADWAKARNIRLRDEKGRFKKGNYRTIGFILQKSIYEKGIKASMFFTKPFQKAFEKLPKEVIEAFGLDIDDLLEFTT
jgi:hypothetical protein